MLIQVTRDLIKRGTCCGNTCPVALAMELAGIESPNVSHGILTGYMNKKRVYVEMPPFLIEWISNYDWTGEGEEFELEIEF